MTFEEALTAASGRSDDCKVTRENMGAESPAFSVDHLGKIEVDTKGALYLGDLLDLDDWIVTPA